MLQGRWGGGGGGGRCSVTSVNSKTPPIISVMKRYSALGSNFEILWAVLVASSLGAVLVQEQ